MQDVAHRVFVPVQHQSTVEEGVDTHAQCLGAISSQDVHYLVVCLGFTRITYHPDSPALATVN